MGDPSPLGEFEQLVLLGVLHGGDEAYGVPVWREIERRTGRRASTPSSRRCRSPTR